MNILITGANGQLGTEVRNLLPDAIATGSKDLDITNRRAVQDFVKKYNINFIINCAAYTDVEKAENDVLNAVKVNMYGPKFLAQACQKMIHISTDYVFDGETKIPYRPEDTPKPLSVYGHTKLLGEREVLRYAHESVVIRTGWLFSRNGNNFFNKIQKLGTEQSEIRVVGDQYGTPTYAPDLAEAIVKIIPQIDDNNSGIYHFSNRGKCSWYQFASEIVKQSGLDCRVNPISTVQYQTTAKRPFYSVLDKSKITGTFGLKIPDWQDALYRCINSNIR